RGGRPQYHRRADHQTRRQVFSKVDLPAHARGNPRDGDGHSGIMFPLTPITKIQLMKSKGAIMIKVKINGEERSWDGDPDLSLLWFVRDEIGLTGTKFGCG